MALNSDFDSTHGVDFRFRRRRRWGTADRSARSGGDGGRAIKIIAHSFNRLLPKAMLPPMELNFDVRSTYGVDFRFCHRLWRCAAGRPPL